MSKYIVIAFPFLFFSLILSAQSTSNLQGNVRNGQTSPLEKATVHILRSSDSTILQSTSTDSKGLFQVSLPAGSYLVHIAHVGYMPWSRVVHMETDKNNHLQHITLLEESKTLDEIQVVGTSRRLIEQRSDRMVVNVENSILSDGLTALEILQRAPGVQVDKDGNIQMRGKPGVNIMINGKLSYLSEKELANILKGTPSSHIKSIELITNPSAKYDAAGNAGLINIVMKKDQRTGIHGTVNAFGGAGRKARYGGGASLSVRHDRLSVHGTYDHTNRGEKEYRNIDRDFGSTIQPERYSEQYSATNEPLTAHNAKLAIDYDIREDLSAGVSWNGNFGSYDNYGDGYNNIILKSNNGMISNSISTNSQTSEWNTHSLNANLVKKFNDNELSGDFDYLYSTYDSDQYLKSDFKKTDYQKTAYISVRRGRTPSSTRLYIGKLDYTHILKEGHKVETGWKSSWINTDNNFQNDTLRSEEWISDKSTSNHFQYLEQIHAGYINYNYDSEDWQLKAGLRVEHTRSSGIQWTWDDRIDRSYTNWFPSISIGYKANEKNTLQLSYSKRIERPDYEDLNPFRFYVDAFVFWEGNSQLKPQFAHSFELTHLLGNSLVTSLYFSQINDVMTSIITQIPNDNVTIRSVGNIRGFKNMGININHNIKPLPFWTMITNVNAFHNRYYGEYDTEKIDNKQWAANGSSMHTFALGKGWAAELTGEYATKELDGMITRNANGMVSGGVMKKLIKDNMTIKLSVNDIFKTMAYSTTSNVAGVAMKQNFNLDSRIALLSLTYKIGKEIDSRAKKQKSEQEQQRIRGGS